MEANQWDNDVTTYFGGEAVQYSVYCIDIVLAIEEEQILYRKEGKGRRCCLENGTSWFAPR